MSLNALPFVLMPRIAKLMQDYHGHSDDCVEMEGAISDESFRDACNRACGELPEGWQIQVVLELDSGCVDLFGPDGDAVDYPSNHERIDDILSDAIEYAKQVEKGEAAE